MHQQQQHLTWCSWSGAAYRVGGYICQLAAHLQSTALLAANQSRSLSRLFTLTDICVSKNRCSAWPTFGMKHRDKPHTEVCATHGSNLSLVLASLWTSCKTTSSVHFSRYSLTITTTAAYTVILFQQMSGQIGLRRGPCLNSSLQAVSGLATILSCLHRTPLHMLACTISCNLRLG